MIEFSYKSIEIYKIRKAGSAMLKVFLCDHNQEDVNKYSNMIKGIAERQNIEIKISSFA
jgi:hypothetical protein